MADCHRCGAEIEYVETEDGRRIALDVFESFGGEGRWAVDTNGVAKPLDRFADQAGQTEHRYTCPSGADIPER